MTIEHNVWNFKIIIIEFLVPCQWSKIQFLPSRFSYASLAIDDAMP